jgi:hypothetical protein
MQQRECPRVMQRPSRDYESPTIIDADPYKFVGDGNG